MVIQVIIQMSVKWQTTRLHRLVNIEKGKPNEEYCVEQVISFQQQTNMEKVFDEVVYPEESTLKKMDHVGMWSVLSLYSDKTGHQTFQPD